MVGAGGWGAILPEMAGEEVVDSRKTGLDQFRRVRPRVRLRICIYNKLPLKQKVINLYGVNRFELSLLRVYSLLKSMCIRVSKNDPLTPAKTVAN